MVSQNPSQGNKNTSELIKEISMTDLLNTKINNILKNKNNIVNKNNINSNYQDLNQILGGNAQSRSINTNKLNNNTNPYDSIYSFVEINKNNNKTEIPIRQLLNELPTGIPGLENMIYYVSQSPNKKKVTITIQAGEPLKNKFENTLETFVKTNALERKNVDFRSLYNVLLVAQSFIALHGKLTDDVGKTDGVYVGGEVDNNKIKAFYYGNMSLKQLIKGDTEALSTLVGGDKIVIEVNGDKASYYAGLLVASLDPKIAGNLARYYPRTEFEKIYKAQQNKGYM